MANTRWTIVPLLLTLSVTPLGAQTREQDDRADLRRRCTLPDTMRTRESRAIQCAEWFIARQGYTDASPVTDTTQVAPEGIEWKRGALARLAARHATLEPHAFGVCEGEDGRFHVAFWGPGHGYARGVTLDPRFGSLRVQHPDFNPEVVTERLHGCHPIEPVPR